MFLVVVHSNIIAVMFNQEGGMVTNKDGEIVREWIWPPRGKLSDPVLMQVIFIGLIFLFWFSPFATKLPFGKFLHCKDNNTALSIF